MAVTKDVGGVDDSAHANKNGMDIEKKVESFEPINVDEEYERALHARASFVVTVLSGVLSCVSTTVALW